jgi:altronate hydrolase
MHKDLLKVDPRDNLLIALRDFHAGETAAFSGENYLLPKDVPVKHKFAMRALAPGDAVIMYGVLVGKAVHPIARGEVITTLNVRHSAADFHSKDTDYLWTPPDVSRWRAKTFLGHHRADGRVGTRNHWIVVPLVFCENRNLSVLQQAFEEELGFAAPQIYRRQVAEMARLYREGKADGILQHSFSPPQASSTLAKVFSNVDGIKFLLHESGCGGTREDANNLCNLLAGYICHPNVAGATVLSLGCQHAQVSILQEAIARRVPRCWGISATRTTWPGAASAQAAASRGRACRIR